MTDFEAQLQSAEDELKAAVTEAVILVSNLRTQVAGGGAATQADVENVHNAVMVLQQLTGAPAPAATPNVPTSASPPTTEPSAPTPAGQVAPTEPTPAPAPTDTTPPSTPPSTTP